MLVWASNFDGQMYVEAVESGTTMNCTRYTLFLERMVAHFAALSPPLLAEDMVIMHDNARPHTAAAVRDWMASHRIVQLPPSTSLLARLQPYGPLHLSKL